MRPKNTNLLASALLVIGTSVTAAFIGFYCTAFDNLDYAARTRLLEHPALTFFITPFLFWVSAYLCRLCAPNAAGNHLQTALNYLKKDQKNLERVYGFFDARLIVIKAFSSLIATFGGGSLGKEGPSMHMSSGIFVIIFNRFSKYFPNVSLESWIAAGSAVGLTIVFNAPLAGIAFAAEKLFRFGKSNLKKGIIWSLICVALVTLIFYRHKSSFAFRIINFDLVTQWNFLILTTLICAIIAAPMRIISFFFCDKLLKIKSSWWHLVPLMFGIIAACINYYCGIYSFSGGIHTIQQTLSGEIILSYNEVIGRIANTFFTFISGCAGGLIAPAMAIGTGIGSILSTIFTEADSGIFLLIGMTSFLAVFLGEPIAAALIVFESTGQEIYSLPFLLVASVSAVLLRTLIDTVSTKKFKP